MATFPEELTNAFEVKNHINGGAYGTIYKVIKRSNQKMYVMKAVVRDNSGSSWKDIETELQVLSWVNPYKLHLDCFFVDGDTFFMIIDYCKAGDLLKAIADKIHAHEQFEEDEIWKYFIQICFGLESLHYNGVIHRDLHPQNILLDENNDIKIADFGISRLLPTKQIQGVFAYLSPRTHSGDIQAKESDIWALGCILYYLCNLEHPFDDNVNKIKNEPSKPMRSEYSKDLGYFVDWCLKKQRIERPTIFDILSHEFIVNKTLSLSITIPQTSAMNAVIFQIQLNEERKRNEQLEKKLSKYKKKNSAKKKEIESLKAELYDLHKIINENVKESTKEKTSLPISQISTATNDPNRKLEITDSLRKKTAEILSRPNNRDLEMDFRATCLAFENSLIPYYPPLFQAYQDYLNAYQSKTSVYNLIKDYKQRTNLIIYSKELKPVNTKSCRLQND